MNRRILGVVLAVALAAVGTFVLVNYVRTAEQRALAGEETVDVLVARERIAEGTAAENIGELAQVERIPLKVLADGGLETLDELEGRVTSVDVLPGEQLVSSRFVQREELEEQREIEVPDGMQLVTFPVDQTRSVGGEVRPGDTVGFIGSFKQVEDHGDAGDDGGIIDVVGNRASGFVSHKVLVTRVQADAQGVGGGAPPPAGGGDEEEDSESEDDSAADDPRALDDAPGGSFLVTVAVEAAVAEQIVFTAEHGTIWLTLEPEEANEDGAGYRMFEEIYE